MAQCHTCQRSFATKQARNQHARDSHSLIAQAFCNVCNASFDSKQALDQHSKDSPRHRSLFDCDHCDRSFTTVGARDQHISATHSHATRLDCKQCNRSYSTKDALDQHVRDSPSHNLAGLLEESLASPADKRSLDDGVSLDILEPLTAGFTSMSLNGNTHSKSQTKKKSRTVKSVQSEILARYGTPNKLEGIQQVCADVGIMDIPQSISACKKALSRIYVNIFDLLDARGSGSSLKTFSSRAALQQYSLARNKIYPKTLAKADSAVRPLLINMF